MDKQELIKELLACGIGCNVAICADTCKRGGLWCPVG